MILFHPAFHIRATRSASFVRRSNYEQMLSEGRKHKKVLFISSKRLTFLFSSTMFLMGFVFFLARIGMGAIVSFLPQGSPLICRSSSLLRFPFSVNCHVEHVGPFVIPDTAKGSTTLY